MAVRLSKSAGGAPNPATKGRAGGKRPTGKGALQSPDLRRFRQRLPRGVLTAEDRAGWIELGKRALARAYGDSEPEYSIADILP
jgi:hypothetical protein